MIFAAFFFYFRVRHYENNLDSELNRQRSFMCGNKNTDVLNMTADNRDLVGVDFRADRHFDSLDLNSELQVRMQF